MAVASPRAEAQARPRRVTILGSTGSVGCNTLDLIERNPEGFEVVALSANGSAERLAEQARRVRAKLAVVADAGRYRELKDALSGSGVEAAAVSYPTFESELERLAGSR